MFKEYFIQNLYKWKTWRNVLKTEPDNPRSLVAAQVTLKKVMVRWEALTSNEKFDYYRITLKRVHTSSEDKIINIEKGLIIFSYTFLSKSLKCMQNEVW